MTTCRNCKYYRELAITNGGECHEPSKRIYIDGDQLNELPFVAPLSYCSAFEDEEDAWQHIEKRPD